MNPRKLAEEALDIPAGKSPLTILLAQRINELANALIAQADLLEKYRESHRKIRAITWAREWLECSCGLCRAYDKLMEGE